MRDDGSECWQVNYIEGGNTVPDMAVFIDKVTDQEVMDTMTSWAPRQCMPPFNEWWNKDTFLCNECHSVIYEAETSQQTLWGGGGGFCDYADECTFAVFLMHVCLHLSLSPSGSLSLSVSLTLCLSRARTLASRSCSSKNNACLFVRSCPQDFRGCPSRFRIFHLSISVLH